MKIRPKFVCFWAPAEELVSNFRQIYENIENQNYIPTNKLRIHHDRKQKSRLRFSLHSRTTLWSSKPPRETTLYITRILVQFKAYWPSLSEEFELFLIVPFFQIETKWFILQKWPQKHSGLDSKTHILISILLSKISTLNSTTTYQQKNTRGFETKFDSSFINKKTFFLSHCHEIPKTYLEQNDTFSDLSRYIYIICIYIFDIAAS